MFVTLKKINVLLLSQTYYNITLILITWRQQTTIQKFSGSKITKLN